MNKYNIDNMSDEDFIKEVFNGALEHFLNKKDSELVEIKLCVKDKNTNEVIDFPIFGSIYTILQLQKIQNKINNILTKDAFFNNMVKKDNKNNKDNTNKEDFFEIIKYFIV